MCVLNETSYSFTYKSSLFIEYQETIYKFLSTNPKYSVYTGQNILMPSLLRMFSRVRKKTDRKYSLEF